MARIKRFDMNLEEFKEVFNNLNKDICNKYDFICHGPGDIPVGTDNYFYFLENSINTGKYENECIEEEVNLYIPKNKLIDLKKELQIVVDVLSGFKVINWKLCSEYGVKVSNPQNPPETLDFLLGKTYKDMVNLSKFFDFGRTRAFMINRARNPCISTSNSYRNKIYNMILHMENLKKHQR